MRRPDEIDNNYEYKLELYCDYIEALLTKYRPIPTTNATISEFRLSRAIRNNKLSGLERADTNLNE